MSLLDSIPFLEMDTRRSRVEDDVSALAPIIIKHLIKILKWKDEDNYNKYLDDINNWLLQVDDYKLKGNKKSKENDYYKWLWEERSSDVDKWINRDLASYKTQPVLVASNEELIDKLSVISKKISVALSKNEYTHITDYIKLIYA